MMDEDAFEIHLDGGQEALKFSIELGDEASSVASLERILEEVVRAAGGNAGVLTTMDLDAGHARSSCYGLDKNTAKQAEPLLEAAVRELTEMGTTPTDLTLRLEKETNSGTALTFPVRAGDRSVGLFCVLSGEEEANFLHDTPGIYHLMVDKVEISIENARLLHRLLAERRWLEAVVQHSSDGVVIVDREGLVVGYNLTMAGLSGWAIGEAAGRPSHDVFPLKLEEQPNDSTSLVKLGRRHFVGKTEQVEAVLTDRNGGFVDVEVSGSPLFDEHNQPLGWVMTVRDITRRKEMERLQRVFLSAVSHELHTPIAIIKGFAGLISDPEVQLTEEVVRDKAAIIVEESVRLEKMVGQMLEATRIQATGMKLNLEPENLGNLVHRVVEKMAPVLRQASCSVNLKIPDDPPLVRLDSGRIQQVLTNLLENASKYAGEGVIELEVYWRGANFYFTVTDSGPGIPEGERERVFQPFQRGRGQLPRGTGLGLFISKSIVEAHGGSIKIEEGEKGGARFRVCLPLRKP